MKIASVETLVVDAGWRPWVFVRIESDDGIVGYGECSDGRSPHAVAAAVRDMEDLLICADPAAHEMRFWDMMRRTRQSFGGIAAKAIAGVENALLDLKAKALGISVVELFGGPTRNDVRLYWSHCGSTRATNHELLGKPPIRTLDDLADVGREVVARGYTALKTNIILPGDPASLHFPGFGGGPGTTDQDIDRALLDHIVAQIGTLRDAVGPGVDICLDLNFNFKPEAARRIARALEPFELLWLEVDLYDPAALRQLRDSTATPICTGENLFHMRGYLPYLRAQCADVYMLDVPWNGFAQSKKVGDLAESHEANIAPHNFYSHLSTFISASLCAVLPNVRIMETDVDDVPWKDELVTRLPEIEEGRMRTPAGPGWGTDIVEEVARAHPWTGGGSNW